MWIILCLQSVDAWRNPFPQTLQTKGLAPEKYNADFFDTYLIITHTCMNWHMSGQVIMSIENLSTLRAGIGLLLALHDWLHFAISSSVCWASLTPTKSQGAS